MDHPTSRCARCIVLSLSLLIGFLASCSERRPDEVGCFVSSPDRWFTAVPPDAPFTTRYKAVRNDVRQTNESTLRLATLCAEHHGDPGDLCHQTQSVELRTQCALTTADEATCAWIGDVLPFSRGDSLTRATLEDTCRCLRLDAEWCEAAIHEGEEEAGLAIARWRDRRAYFATCSSYNMRPCWWLLRELLGYPVDGPAVTAWDRRLLSTAVARGLSRRSE